MFIEMDHAPPHTHQERPFYLTLTLSRSEGGVENQVECNEYHDSYIHEKGCAQQFQVSVISMGEIKGFKIYLVLLDKMS